MDATQTVHWVLFAFAAWLMSQLVHFLFEPILASFKDINPSLMCTHRFEDPNYDLNGGSDGLKRRKGASTLQFNPFPSLFNDASIYLSLVVPAYNEASRLPEMMKETMTYLSSRARSDSDFTFEIILVDDGSRDDTYKVALEYTSQYGSDKVRVMRLIPNRGKGGAVQQGMMGARGHYVLMVDADGATRIADLEALEAQMRKVEKDGFGVSIGSRAQYESQALAERAWYRNILMHGFHFYVSLMCVRGIRDTQCGFKLFTRKAARHLFFNQKLRRWSFDVELLFIAQRLSIPIAEVPVNWMEIPGSKLDVLVATLQMARDLMVIRFAHATGLWSINQPYQQAS